MASVMMLLIRLSGHEGSGIDRRLGLALVRREKTSSESESETVLTLSAYSSACVDQNFRVRSKATEPM